jgi:hypothetical protein
LSRPKPTGVVEPTEIIIIIIKIKISEHHHDLHNVTVHYVYFVLVLSNKAV